MLAFLALERQRKLQASLSEVEPDGASTSSSPPPSPPPSPPQPSAAASSAAGAAALFTVVVPEGLSAGQEFTVSHNGQEYNVTVPSGAAANMAIEVELPVSPGHNDDVQLCVVTVPEGVGEGDALTVAATWGGTFEVTVPVGLKPGDEMQVELPSTPPKDSGSAAASAASACTGGGTSCCACEPPSPTGTYAVGEKVQVHRTDGSWSPCTITDYDVVSDTYTVRLLLSGQTKYLVTDNDLQPLGFQAERAGDHWVGRRVQVPCVGALSKDDVMGEVRTFDERSRTYDVALDSGLVKRGLKADEIRARVDKKREIA